MTTATKAVTLTDYQQKVFDILRLAALCDELALVPLADQVLVCKVTRIKGTHAYTPVAILADRAESLPIPYGMQPGKLAL